MREWKEKDEAPFREGKCFGGIYHTLEGELEALQGAVYTAYASTNALYPGVFPSVRKYEAELIAMATSLVGGVNARGEPLAGILTSGGTESILLAIKGHRDWAIKEKGIPLGEGEVLCGCTAHGALDKACEYFGLRLIKLPVRATDQRLDPAVVAAHLSRRTVLIYASAPTFPHGVVDPVEELAALAKAQNVGLHVDNCLGGVLLSFMRKAGIPTPKFDFAVDGVTSVSIDLHKYGYCSKGASAVVFRDAHLRHFAFSTVTDWSGGLYVTHTTQGSRSGAIIASSWATLMHIGEEGYLRAARTVHALVQRIVKEIPTMPGLELVTVPDASAVAFTSTRYNIHAFVSELKKRTGWTLAAMQKPPAAQVCVSERLEPEIERFLADLRATAAFMSEHTDIVRSAVPSCNRRLARRPVGFCLVLCPRSCARTRGQRLTLDFPPLPLLPPLSLSSLVLVCAAAAVRVRRGVRDSGDAAGLEARRSSPRLLRRGPQGEAHFGRGRWRRRSGGRGGWGWRWQVRSDPRPWSARFPSDQKGRWASLCETCRVCAGESDRGRRPPTRFCSHTSVVVHVVVVVVVVVDEHHDRHLARRGLRPLVGLCAWPPVQTIPSLSLRPKIHTPIAVVAVRSATQVDELGRHEVLFGLVCFVDFCVAARVARMVRENITSPMHWSRSVPIVAIGTYGGSTIASILVGHPAGYTFQFSAIVGAILAWCVAPHPRPVLSTRVSR